MPESKEFEPLMLTVQQVLEALKGQPLTQAAADAVQQLESKFTEYRDCCCFRAHVVPYKTPEGD
jgi:hypothetical protein